MSRILILAMIAGLSIAQQPATAIASDADFLVKAAEVGMMEAEVAKVAMDRASHPDVKAFARRVFVDHTIANDEIVKLAKSKNVTLKDDPTKPMKTDRPVPTKPEHAATPAMASLVAMEGAAFDRAFVDQMVKDHLAAVEMFKTQSSDGKDADIEDWVERKIPTLKELLRLARELQEKMVR
jgi:putative membrane protein